MKNKNSQWDENSIRREYTTTAELEDQICYLPKGIIALL